MAKKKGPASKDTSSQTASDLFSHSSIPHTKEAIDEENLASGRTSTIPPSKAKAMFQDPSLAALDELTSETLAVMLYEDERPLAGALGYLDWRMCGYLSALVQKNVVTGKLFEKTLVSTNDRVGASRIFFFGCGKRADVDRHIDKIFANVVQTLKDAVALQVAVALPEPAASMMKHIEQHLYLPLGDRLDVVFGPDPILFDAKTTRPVPRPLAKE